MRLLAARKSARLTIKAGFFMQDPFEQVVWMTAACRPPYEPCNPPPAVFLRPRSGRPPCRPKGLRQGRKLLVEPTDELTNLLEPLVEVLGPGLVVQTREVDGAQAKGRAVEREAQVATCRTVSGVGRRLTFRCPSSDRRISQWSGTGKSAGVNSKSGPS